MTPPTLTAPPADVVKKISTVTETKLKSGLIRRKNEFNISSQTGQGQAAFGGGFVLQKRHFHLRFKKPNLNIIFF